MKKATYNNKGRQIIASGWKRFDKQTNCITTGNAFCNTQVSSYIRPWKETECAELAFPKGQLMQFDMKPFTRHNIPTRIKEILLDKERQEEVILYIFFTINREKHLEPFYWVVTDTQNNYIDGYLVVPTYCHYFKRGDAASEILSYITNEDDKIIKNDNQNERIFLSVQY